MSVESRVKFEGAYGERTDAGFVVHFPNVLPAEKHTPKLFDNRQPLLWQFGEKYDRRFGASTAEDPLVFRSRTSGVLLVESDKAAQYASLDLHGNFWATALEAYNPHFPFCIRPEVLFQTIAHEVGEYVRQNGAACAHLFTDKPAEQQRLTVVHMPEDSWGGVISKFRAALAEKIDPTILGTFLPEFSTSDVESQTVTLLTFMDTVSQWYSYGSMYCCGFPKILVAGTVEDWERLRLHVKNLEVMFDGLKYYFADLVRVLNEIVRTVKTGAVVPEFWGSMFRYYSNSCPPRVDGWLSAFVAYIRTGKETVLRSPHQLHWESTMTRSHDLYFSCRPRGLNFVTLHVDYPGVFHREYALVAGVIGSECQGGFLTPRLGYAVALMTDESATK